MDNVLPSNEQITNSRFGNENTCVSENCVTSYSSRAWSSKCLSLIGSIAPKKRWYSHGSRFSEYGRWGSTSHTKFPQLLARSLCNMRASIVAEKVAILLSCAAWPHSTFAVVQLDVRGCRLQGTPGGAFPGSPTYSTAFFLWRSDLNCFGEGSPWGSRWAFRVRLM